MTDDSSMVNGLDVSHYQEWPKVTTPSGGVYYAVPGTGLVYAPQLSAMTGKKMFFRNPKPTQDAQAKADADKQAALDQMKKQASPMGQVMPVVGGVAGVVGANQLIKHLSPATPTQLINTPNGPVMGMSDGTLTGPGATAFTGGQAAAPTGAAQSFTQAATNGAPISGAPVADAGANFGAVPGAVAQGNGTYLLPDGSYSVTVPSEMSQTTAPMFGSGGSIFNTEGMIGPQGSFAPLNVAGAAIGAYGAFKASQMQNKREGIMSGAASGAMAGTSIAPGIGTAIGAVVGGLAGAAAHETTKHRSTRRYGELASTGGGDTFQSMVQQGQQESVGGSDTWDLGDDKSQAPIDLMTRSYGVLKTFGPQWASLSDTQRQEITRQLVDKDLLNSKQGDYLIDKPDEAQAIFHSVVNGTPAGQVANNKIAGTMGTGGAVVSAAPPPAMHRTFTQSPGIDLNGQRINYQAIGQKLANRLNQKG